MTNWVSKIAKIGLRVLLVLAVLLAFASFLISIPSIQTWVVGKVNNSLSYELQTEVSVGSVDLSWNGRMEFKKLLVRDQQNDTLFYIDNLKFRLIGLDRSARWVQIGTIDIERPLVNFRQDEGSDELNLQFLVDATRPESPTGKVWTLDFKRVNLTDGTFRFRRHGYDAPLDRAFDENHFAFNQINGSLKDFELIGDSLNFKVKELRTVERSGLEVLRLVCKSTISSSGMEYADLQLRTSNSMLEDYLAFEYTNYQQFQHFLDSVYVRSHLRASHISIKDLAYFSDNLKPYVDQLVGISGQAEGYVSNFDVDSLVLDLGATSQLRGDLTLKGLPYWQTSHMDLRVDRLKSEPSDVEALFHLALPDRLIRFEYIDFTGRIAGIYTDFAAEGILQSNLGELKSRVLFEWKDEAKARYSGTLVATDFDVGTFLDKSQLGKSSFSFDVREGEGLTFTELNTRFVGHVDYVMYNGVSLEAIDAEGVYTDQYFNGKASLKDEMADFTFNGEMNFKPIKPVLDFEAIVNKLDLQALRLDTVPSVISGTCDVQTVGSHIDDFLGEARIANVHVERAGRSLDLERFQVSAMGNASYRQIDLNSDNIQGKIEGKFSLSNFSNDYQNFLHILFPDFYDSVDVVHDIDAKAHFAIQENDYISFWTPYDVNLGNGYVNISYNSKEEKLESHLKLDAVDYETYTGKAVDLFVRKRPFQLLNLSNEIAELYQDEKLLTHDFLLNSSILPNYMEFMLDFADTSDVVALRSYGAMTFSDDTIDIALEASNLFLDGQRWEVREPNQLVYTDRHVDVNTFALTSGAQSLEVNGRISDVATDGIVILTNQLDLANFNALVEPAFNFTLGGVANDSIGFYQVLKRPGIYGNLNITNLAINEDTLGNFSIKTKSLDHPLMVELQAKVTDGLFRNVSVDGKLDMSADNGWLDLRVSADHASVEPMEVWFEGIASDFSGNVDGIMRVSGSFDKPAFRGRVKANDVAFLVDYLNVRYSVDDYVVLTDKSIEFNNVRVRDRNDRTAKVVGQIRHDYFSDMVLDILIKDADRILVLNTTADDNELFYGSGYAVGNATFKGPTDDVEMDIKATTAPGTHLIIPVYDESDNNLVDYISFKSVQTEEDTVTEVEVNDENAYALKFDIDITEDAEIDLLFDEVLDDRISGKGIGNIRMEYASGEDFFMYGSYEITEGIYPYSSPLVVSEKFDLRPGGQIVWNGDPYNALIDLQAAVRRRAKPIDLMAGLIEGNTEQYNQQINMDVILNLKGELFSPEITFDWEFPDQTAIGSFTEFNTLIKRVEADQDELNRQIFSLLTFGSFSPAQDYGQNLDVSQEDYRGLVNSSVSTFLSNQLTNWISAYNKDFELGIDYQTATSATNQEARDFIISARQRMLQERLELAFVKNFTNNSAINPYTVDLVYKVKKDGSLKLKAYHRLTNDPSLGDVSNVATTGVGFYFRKQFDKLRLKARKDD